MKIHNYSPITGAFIITAEAREDIDPHSITGWIVPAHATLITLPEFDQYTESCNFIGGKWVVTKLPIIIPPVIIPPTPEELAAEAANKARNIRVGLLHAADVKINILEDNKKDSKVWRKYRQALRDITEQPTFPESITWPTIP